MGKSQLSVNLSFFFNRPEGYVTTLYMNSVIWIQRKRITFIFTTPLAYKNICFRYVFVTSYFFYPLKDLASWEKRLLYFSSYAEFSLISKIELSIWVCNECRSTKTYQEKKRLRNMLLHQEFWKIQVKCSFKELKNMQYTLTSPALKAYLEGHLESLRAAVMLPYAKHFYPCKILSRLTECKCKLSYTHVQ